MAFKQELEIRPYQPQDAAAMQAITYRTGLQGEDLTGSGLFADARLWYLIFIDDYARYEPEHFFVLWDHMMGTPAGFICGTPDTAAQRTRFHKKGIPRILWRSLWYTLWRYPRTFRNLLRLSKVPDILNEPEPLDGLQKDFPAHLHINLLPAYQRMGLGTMMIAHFEQHLTALGVHGVHLQTSSQNRKAVPFYQKNGYDLLREVPAPEHPLYPGLHLLLYAKKLPGE